jgi:hypothetical protein
LAYFPERSGVLKKEITYENPFTEKEVTEEHYFHISKADLVEMEMEEHGAKYTKDGQELTGMQAKLQKIVDSEDGKAIMAEFKDIIRRSYGKKEGDRFLKSREISEDFMSSEAFSQLLFELCTDAGAAADFVNGIVPGNLEQIAAEVRQQAEETTPENGAPPMGPRPEAVAQDPTGLTEGTTPRVLTRKEVTEMDSDELKSGLATGRYKLS